MFGAMLPAVRRQRDERALPEVQDLLERMSNAFGGHEEKTREHERLLRERLAALGAAPSRPRELGMGAAALLRGNLGRVGGQNHGANARDAFVFEHLEIASWGFSSSWPSARGTARPPSSRAAAAPMTTRWPLSSGATSRTSSA